LCRSHDPDGFLTMDGTTTVFLVALAASSVLAITLAIALITHLRRATPMKRTFDAASVGIVHVAIEGRWLRLNDKMLDITGYTRDELLDMHFSDITVKEDLPENSEQNTHLRSGEIDSYTLEKRYLRKDGSPSKPSIRPSGRRRSTTSPILPGSGRCGACRTWGGKSSTSPSRMGTSRGRPSSIIRKEMLPSN